MKNGAFRYKKNSTQSIREGILVNKIYMTVNRAFRLFFSRGLDFAGRSSRREFWLGVLPNAIIMIALAGLLVFSLTAFSGTINAFSITMIILFGLFCLAEAVPSISLIFRRMHDIGKSGAYIFVLLIPVIGFVWYIYLVTRPTDCFAENGDRESKRN